MSTDVATTERASTALTIADDQTRFTSQQVTVLRHLGVDGADEDDLDVFFHVAKRTKLDPFARQIYMIGRNTYDQRQDRWVTKQTIQTGIDGYRLIGRRAADAARARISVSAPEWAHEDGSWRPVWMKAWGSPIAARITITRDGEPFTGVALFEEYAQTKRNGDLTSMWAQRPGGQIAKCAEALAWRLAFPQDLAGVYVEEELQHADRQEPEHPATGAGVAGLRDIVQPPAPSPADEEPVDAEVVEEPAAPARDWAGEAEALDDVTALRSLYAEAAAAGATREEKAAIARRGVAVSAGGQS
ncbi:recombinase RecT [Cellulomonas sp. C5510]|uniref:recombinase RecT n=1 Tax=Cellulomonas sp. C5510 TaxID=2871170 RepID=UPI001C967A12|nr:recombinase RecT [Cellulomonas sp. C5510]QZN86930.1 recombinase RecT [Cellulomonas sp. C5510]